ncbi:MAG: ABC transporter permease [Myxococcaceae bacterium]
MSVRSTLRALPTLFRVGFSEMVAYRAEMLVWVLATTMPLIMLALWSAVAHDAPMGRFDQQDFVAYFLATFIVRQLTGAWVAWQLSFEVRTGTLAMRLLRPIHPMVSYAVENLAAIPLRMIVSLPVAVLALVLTGASRLPRDPLLWAIFLLSLLGGWLITFLANAGIGTLALWTGSSVKVMDVWLALFMVFSGYLIPVELFPPAIRGTIEVLPFRYQIGFPVELLTRGLDRGAALRLLLGQWIWVGLFVLGVRALWRRGLQRFAAYGG